jgi:hypothetical protein
VALQLRHEGLGLFWAEEQLDVGGTGLDGGVGLDELDRLVARCSMYLGLRDEV